MVSKKGTWPQALATFLFPILLILTIRWAVIEPFVIPSGSMIPTLLIHDHILVKKFEFGLKWPFTKSWIWMWQKPKRGQIVVFRFPENDQVFYVKRLIGLPGDDITMSDRNIWVNGKLIEKQPVSNPEKTDSNSIEEYEYFFENLGSQPHYIRYQRDSSSYDTATDSLSNADETFKKAYKVPPGKYFMVGDNRDESADGRVWGFVPEANLVGTPAMILMGCTESLPNSSFCSPRHLTISRIFKRVL
jgi:signal peptidase I